MIEREESKDSIEKLSIHVNQHSWPYFKSFLQGVTDVKKTQISYDSMIVLMIHPMDIIRWNNQHVDVDQEKNQNKPIQIIESIVLHEWIKSLIDWTEHTMYFANVFDIHLVDKNTANIGWTCSEKMDFIPWVEI